MIYIKIENQQEYLNICSLLKEDKIYCHYGISHQDKYIDLTRIQLSSNIINKNTYENSKTSSVFIFYDPILVQVSPNGRVGGNMYYQTFMTGVYDNEKVKNLTEEGHEFISSYIFRLNYFADKLIDKFTLLEKYI